MWRRRKQLTNHNVCVKVITFEPPQRVIEYQNEVQWNWPILIDERYSAFNHYTRGKANWFTLAHPISILKYLCLIFRGQSLAQKGGDIFQLGADVVVAPHGEIIFQNSNRTPHDRPIIDQVINIIAAHADPDST